MMSNTISDAWLLDINTGRWREVRDGGCVCVTKPRSGSIMYQEHIRTTYIAYCLFSF